MLEAIDLTWIAPGGLALTLFVFGRPSWRKSQRRPRRATPEPGPIPNARQAQGSSGAEKIQRKQAEEVRSLQNADIAKACITLGLSIRGPATRDGVMAAWKKKIKEHHPDRGGDPLKFKAVMEAKCLLLRKIEEYESSVKRV